ncbi:hypothetical protein GS466_24990 [Rhodococcus hoagii]|nr:hypothetical protein [Prescottella equi]
MSDPITADEYEIAAKVADAEGDNKLRDILLSRAEHQRAESARDEEAEQLAELMLAAEREHWLSVGLNRYEDGFQGLTGDFRAAYLNAAAKAREIAEWLIAEAMWTERVVFGEWPTDDSSSTPDGTPEKPWERLGDVPDGVDVVVDCRSIKWRRIGSGWTFREDGKPPLLHHGDDLAPFVRVDGAS